MNAATPLETASRGAGAPVARVNAVFFDWMDGYMHWKYGPLKARLFSGLPDLVVELGAGAGANFRYFPPGIRVIAVEPNSHMHPRLLARARRRGIDVELRPCGAERLAMPDESVDAVVASLVLCTVEDAAKVVAEVLRVLRPGGRFVCIEHVAAPPSTAIGRLQRWVHRPWRWLFEGCHTHRDTGALLHRAGFSRVAIEPFTWRSVFLPVRPQIAAVCVK
jgi:ubiquinone/menaquinone biosynthesis C-methylase UbiE